MLEVKFELNINAVLELKPNYRTIVLLPFKQLQMCSQRNLVKTKLMNINEKSGCNERMKDNVPEVMPTTTKNHIKGTLREYYEEIKLYFIALKMQRIKCWKLIQL